MTTPANWEYSPPFVANELSQMKRGTVTLHIPLDENVIQVGTVSIEDVGEILVKKSWRSITVSNTDGSPIQAGIIDNHSSEEEATPILKKPVDKLIFRKMKDLTGQVCWFADGEDVDDREAISRFARVVGMFAITKQGGSFTAH